VQLTTVLDVTMIHDAERGVGACGTTPDVVVGMPAYWALLVLSNH
jgi:hypothetical protein